MLPDGVHVDRTLIDRTLFVGLYIDGSLETARFLRPPHIHRVAQSRRRCKRRNGPCHESGLRVKLRIQQLDAARKQLDAEDGDETSAN